MTGAIDSPFVTVEIGKELVELCRNIKVRGNMSPADRVIRSLNCLIVTMAGAEARNDIQMASFGWE